LSGCQLLHVDRGNQSRSEYIPYDQAICQRHLSDKVNKDSPHHSAATSHLGYLSSPKWSAMSIVSTISVRSTMSNIRDRLVLPPGPVIPRSALDSSSSTGLTHAARSLLFETSRGLQLHHRHVKLDIQLTDLKALIFPCSDCISSSFWFSSVLSVALKISMDWTATRPSYRMGLRTLAFYNSSLSCSVYVPMLYCLLVIDYTVGRSL
jgi:hypothetical protein